MPKPIYGRIYQIVNSLTGELYIGFTTQQLSCRFGCHIGNAFKRKQEFHLYRAMRKYGLENFSIEEIYISMDIPHTLRVMEPYFIEKFRPAYNMALGGTAPMMGRKHSEQSKLQMSINTSGEKNPNWGGKLFTPEVRKKIAEKAKLRSRKKYVLESPTGETIEIIGLHEFCKNNNLNVAKMYRSKKHGWKIVSVERIKVS